MNNREAVLKIIEAFDNNDTETILSCMTDDVEWNMAGDKPVIGKDNMRKIFENPGMKIISSTKDHIIVDGDNAAVNGVVQCSDKNGLFIEMYYCDIYELRDGKVKKMISIGVDKKK